MISLSLFKEISVRLPRKKIMQMFELIYSKETKRNWKGEVNLIFSDDNRLLALNKQFRNINKTTDVLSFNIDKPTTDDAVFGEVYISIPQAMRQAESYKASLGEELLRLSCHGFLHLLGYDHMNEPDEHKMKEKEDYHLGMVERK